jgi:hypothetical protein
MRHQISQRIYRAATRNFQIKELLVAWLTLIGVLHISPVLATDGDERRIQIALSIFPRIIAVDNDFQHKLNKNKKVLLVFVYATNKDKAQRLAEQLSINLTNVAGFPFTATAVSIKNQLMPEAAVPSAIFAAESFDADTFRDLLAYAADNHRILFSPYAGDVERGASAGVAITSRVKPFFNITTLEKSEVQINPVLMNLSQRYE